MTGQCNDPKQSDGTVCDDGDGLTVNDSCQNGICVGGNRLNIQNWN